MVNNLGLKFHYIYHWIKIIFFKWLICNCAVRSLIYRMQCFVIIGLDKGIVKENLN